MPDLSSYRLFRVGSRPLLAFPDGPADRRLKCAALFRCDTPARRLLRALLSTIVVCGADRLLCRPMASAGLRLPDLDLDRLLEQASACTGCDELSATLMWPPDPARGRIYVLLSARGTLKDFVKVGFSDFDVACLENEARMLKSLNGMTGRPFRVPELLFGHREHESLYRLAVKALPQAARVRNPGHPCAPQEILCFLAGHSPDGITQLPIAACGWYSEYEGNPMGTGRVRDLLGSTGDIEVAWAHGDLGPGNLLVFGNETCLIDWENAMADLAG